MFSVHSQRLENEKHLAAQLLGASEAKASIGAQLLKAPADDLNVVSVPCVIIHWEGNREVWAPKEAEQCQGGHVIGGHRQCLTCGWLQVS